MILSIRELSEKFDTFRPLATWSQWSRDLSFLLFFGHPLLSNGLFATELRRVFYLLSNSLLLGKRELSFLGI